MVKPDKLHLLGKSLASFTFHTSFELVFDHAADSDRDEYLEKGSIPEVLVMLDCEWWMDDREAWNRRIREFGPLDSPSPEEPWQAFELVRLRWGDGNRIVQSVFDENRMVLTFASGRKLIAHVNMDEMETLSLLDVEEQRIFFSVE